jgi:hypothetical protein
MKQKILLIEAMLAIVLFGAATSSHAGFFDNLRMAMGSESILFVGPSAAPNMAPYRNLLLQSASPNMPNPLLPVIESKLTGLRVNQNVYFAEVARTLPPPAVMRKKKWALVDVSTNQWVVSNTDGYENRTQCPKGKFACKDATAAHYAVFCRTRKASVSARLLVRDALSRATLVSDGASSQVESKVCNDVGGNLDEPEMLLGRAADAVAGQLVAKFAPSVTKQPLELLDSDAAQPELGEQLKQAYRLAAGGNIPAALNIYNKVIAEHAPNGTVLFNAAYCQHAQGHYKLALDLYQQAKAAPNAPNDLIAKYQVSVSDYVAAGINSAVD